ncbi:DNA/RNA polymerases superfamily protein [Tanacetum coccineum]
MLSLTIMACFETQTHHDIRKGVLISSVAVLPATLPRAKTGLRLWRSCFQVLGLEVDAFDDTLFNLGFAFVGFFYERLAYSFVGTAAEMLKRQAGISIAAAARNIELLHESGNSNKRDRDGNRIQNRGQGQQENRGRHDQGLSGQGTTTDASTGVKSNLGFLIRVHASGSAKLVGGLLRDFASSTSLYYLWKASSRTSYASTRDRRQDLQVLLSVLSSRFDDRNRIKPNLLPIHMLDFDVILGMDWLASHRATIDCYARTVIFGNVRQPEFVYHGSSPLKSVKLISAMKARTLISHGCQGFLASVMDTSLESPNIENLSVVREFADELKETVTVMLGMALLDASFPWGEPCLIVMMKDGIQAFIRDHQRFEAITHMARPYYGDRSEKFSGIEAFTTFCWGFSRLALPLTQLSVESENFKHRDRGDGLELLKIMDTTIQLPSRQSLMVVADALSQKSGMIACFDSIILHDLERLDVELCVRGSGGYWLTRHEDRGLPHAHRSMKAKGTIGYVFPNDQTLREKVMTEAHSSPFTIHPGSTKMYRDLKQYFWWNGMKQDVATFVSKCMTCQQVKIEHQRASGLLQPLEIPMWKWDEISMDFVTGLPTTQKRHDAIWVVVDRLTKSAHFLPIRKNYGISKLAEIFRQEIVRLHGTPTSIVSDRDPKFTSHFWKGLQKAWGTRLKFSTAFHPQTDGQSERTIQTLEDMLRACALEWTGSWDEYLCLVEFAYNNSWHASIKAAPFELLYGRKCRAPICWDEVGVLNVLDQGQAPVLDSLGTVVIWNVLETVSYTYGTSSLLCTSRYSADCLCPRNLNPFWNPFKRRVMRNKIIPFVKILWKNHPEREATWETEESMRASYPHFFV